MTDEKPAQKPGNSGAPNKDKEETPPPPPQHAKIELPLADELGIQDINDPIFGGRGRLFSAAGRQSPIAEFTSQFLIMHPPQKPFTEQGPSEDIVIRIDKRGILLDELGRPKHIPGAKFNGNQLWFMGERKRGTLRHFAAWFDSEGNAHRLFVNNEALTTEIIYRLRNKTHDGEISIFPDIKSD